MNFLKRLVDYWPGELHGLKMELLFTKHIPFPQEALLPPAIGVWKCPGTNGANQAPAQVTVLGPRASFHPWLCYLGQQQWCCHS